VLWVSHETTLTPGRLRNAPFTAGTISGVVKETGPVRAPKTITVNVWDAVAPPVLVGVVGALAGPAFDEPHAEMQVANSAATLIASVGTSPARPLSRFVSLIIAVPLTDDVAATVSISRGTVNRVQGGGRSG
jgi:hypothetical protein